MLNHLLRNVEELRQKKSGTTIKGPNSFVVVVDQSSQTFKRNRMKWRHLEISILHSNISAERMACGVPSRVD